MKTVKLPNGSRFDHGSVFVDLETRKVPAAPYMGQSGYVMQNGEVLKNRWQAFLIGIARDDRLMILDDPREKVLLHNASLHIGTTRPVVYGATRQFDEMILKGRFTNARRAHEPAPFYPAMPGAEDLRWECRKHGERIERVGDLPSKGISQVWAKGDKMPVYVHNLRDLAELVLQYGYPNPLARSFLWGMMRDYEFCTYLLRRAR